MGGREWGMKGEKIVGSKRLRSNKAKIETKKRGGEGEGERRNGGRKARKKEEEKKGVRKEE